VGVTEPNEAIRLDNVSFRYADQREWALRDVSLRIERGEMVVVMGATGAGKSTLAKCLNRTVPAFQAGTMEGGIALFGESLGDRDVADLAGTVGLVSQDFEAQLFATNVVQELAFGMEQLGVPADEMRRRVPQALATVGLAGFEHRDPTTLSGGEKQRLAIAATLVLQPRILVFDEPTTDLDPAGKLEIFAVLARMRCLGYTLLLIEHETVAAEKADRLVVLNAGRVVADDAPNRVLPDVRFLDVHGVRPLDGDRIAAAMQVTAADRSGEGLASAVRALGLRRSTSPATPHTAGEAPSAQATPFIEVEAVGFAYEGRARALDRVSLRIDTGEFIALIGQNGSGKTTLAKHLNGLLHPTSGRVLLRGQDVRTLPLDAVAAQVGYVFQNPDHQIFAATVAEEVAFGPRNLGLGVALVTERVDESLAAVGLRDLADADPFLLSKGHRQRLAVASLLALRPCLLILDEPTTGLDYSEQRHMMDLVVQLHRNGMAILMITHSPWVVAEYAQRGVLMRAGRVQFDGALRTLFEQEALLAEAHFRLPDVTWLGRRFGFTPLTVDEFVAGLSPASPQA
jgi:energy-coupling factor transporter ATP-binding protein EcfA2